MKVYRYVGLYELQATLNGEVDKIGRKFVRTRCNTHTYLPNRRYLHFFKHIKSIEKLTRFKNQEEVGFICEYDIPMLVLLTGRGFGFYGSKGYDVDNDKELEYAIINTMVKPKWLKRYVKHEKNVNLTEIF